MSKKKNAKRQKKQGKWKAGLKAGCLALGMATAWGGEARGDVTFEIAAMPNVSITEAFIYYGMNSSGGAVLSLGDLQAGVLTKRYQTFGYDIDEFTHGYGELHPYVVVGLYNNGGNEGVAITFPNDNAITNNLSWSDIFESPSTPEYYRYTEAEVIDRIHTASTLSIWPLENVLDYYGAYANKPCATLYNQQSVLTCFSDATFGGFVTVSVVPEPAAWILLIGAAGSLLFWRRDLLTMNKN
jgi:hypothetical protein